MATINYTTKTRVAALLGLSVNDISTDLLNAADAEIESRTNTIFEVRNATLNVNGTAERWIELPVDYIASLSSVTMGDINNENITTINSDDIIIDNEQATVWFKTDADIIITDTTVRLDTVWTAGINNCHFTGSFGKATPEIVKELATLIVIRSLQTRAPNLVGTDIVFEVMSKYTYRLREKGRRTLDQLIDYYFDQLVPAPLNSFFASIQATPGM